MSEERVFSRDEANGLLPWLQGSLARIREARQAVLAGGERIRGTVATDGGGDVGRAYLDALTTLRREIESITGRGIVLRDGDTGLVDFPSVRDGRKVFLCWRMGETGVDHYHARDSGIAGRKPL